MTDHIQHPSVTVLVNALSARHGGGQTYVANLLSRLPGDGLLKIYVLAPDSLTIPSGNPQVKRIQLNWPVENPFLRAVWERVRLPQLVSRIKADVLFCPGGMIGCRVPRGCKSVTMFRNMIPFDDAQMRRYRTGYLRLRNSLLRRTFLDSMQRADMVIFLSNYGRQVIESHAGRRLGNAITIPHGLGRDFQQPVPARAASAHGLSSESGYLLYVSTLDYYKAQVEVVKAYALLKALRPTKEKLVLVGSENPEYGERVRREVARLGLQDSVLLTGPIPHAEMPEIYRNATINIFASECENCPNILIEALASGRPILSSHYPPMSEFGGDAVQYFDPRSPQDLAAHLVALLEHPQRMNELAAKALQRSRRYDGEACARQTWHSIYQLALN